MLRELERITRERFRLLGEALEQGRPTSPVPGAELHLQLVERAAETGWAWGADHAGYEVGRLRARERFNEPPKAGGPQPKAAVVWAQSRAGLQGKWERDFDAQVQRVITQGLSEGLNNRDIMKRLAQVFPGFSRHRLENIARTETASAYNAGRLATFRDSRFVVAVQFSAIIDDRTTEICKARDGRILLLSDPALDANTPPLHYQCRSTLVPVDKFDLADLQDGVQEVEERFFGWLTSEDAPKSLEQAQDWSGAPEPLRGFGKLSMPTSGRPDQAPTPLDSLGWGPDTNDPRPRPAVVVPDLVGNAIADTSKPLFGQVLEFKSGEPPAWEAIADKVGFLAGPKPESKPGAKDGQLPIDHWKKVHPVESIFEDPSKLLATGKKQATGVILVESDGVWLVEPTNHFGGYVNTFPKGGVSSGLTHQQSALKEVWEETGMQAELLAFLGEFEKTTSQTKYYLGKKVSGQPWSPGWETQSVKLVPWDKLPSLIGQSTNAEGKKADLATTKALAEMVQDALKAYPGPVDVALSKYSQQAAKDYADSLAAKVAATPPVPPVAKPKRVRKPKAQLLAKTEPATLPADWEESWTPLQQSEFGSVGSPRGSNPGGEARRQDGSRWYLKFPRNSDHARNEMLAAQLYRLAGAEVPEIRLLETHTGGLGLASKMLDGLSKSPAGLLDETVKGVGEHFAADAWLANWDVVGATHDNLLLQGNRAIRIDVGGSLLFRAQGAPKGAAWNDEASEWFSMRTMAGSTTSQVFSGATGEQLVEGARRVASITPEQIQDAVRRAGFSDSVEKELVDRLVARQKAIAAYAEEYAKLGARGKYTDPDAMVRDVKGASASSNLHKAQEARRKQMSALIGKQATDAYADLWNNGYSGWQGDSNSPGGKILREEFELLVKRKPTSRPDIRAAMAAQQVLLRNTFAADSITLVRGFRWDRVEEQIIAAAATGKTRARVSCWELTSWATNRGAAFSGVKAELEITLDRIAGGMGVSPGFNRQGGIQWPKEDELIAAADEIDGSNSWFHLELARTTSPRWGSGTPHATVFDYVDHLRRTQPAMLDRILKDHGANQTLSKRKKSTDQFRASAEPWQSEGMMQQPQIEAEADKMATAYESRQAEIKKLEAEGKVATLGQGLSPEEIWGQGPFGRKR